MISYSVEYVLRANTKGAHFIYLEITINGKRKFRSTKIRIDKKYWDIKTQSVKATHPDHEIINVDLQARKQNIINPIVEAQIANKETVAINTRPQQKDLFLFVEDFISRVKSKRQPSTIKNYQKHLNKLKKFAGDHLTFDQVDNDFLSRYEAWIKGEGTAKRERTKKSTYVTAIWRTLRTWFNEAITAGVTSNYPFKTYENPGYDPGEKDYLTVPELNRFEAALTGRYKLPCLYFLLGCYSGLRVSDWFQYSRQQHIENSRMRLRAKKNNEWVTMKMSKPLKRIVAAIGDHKLKIAEQTINEYIKEVCKSAKINKHLTTHCGRKTFAVTICADHGISSETCATLMGITIKTCVDSYYRVTSVKIDRETEEAWSGL